MGGLLSSGGKTTETDPPADPDVASASSSHDSTAGRVEPDPAEALMRVPIHIEQGWHEAVRISEMLRVWGGGTAKVPEQRAEAALALAVAYKNRERLRDATDDASGIALVDLVPRESAAKKKLVKKLRTVARAAPKMRLPHVSDPTGKESVQWRGRWVDERVTAVVIALDGLPLRGNSDLRAQRKALIKALYSLSEAAATWAAKSGSGDEGSGAASSKASTAVPAAAAGFESSEDEEGQEEEEDVASTTAAPAPAPGAASSSSSSSSSSSGVDEADGSGTTDAEASAGEATQEDQAQDNGEDGWITAGKRRGKRRGPAR